MQRELEEPSEVQSEDMFWKLVIYIRRQNAMDEQAEADRYDDSYEQVCYLHMELICLIFILVSLNYKS